MEDGASAPRRAEERGATPVEEGAGRNMVMPSPSSSSCTGFLTTRLELRAGTDRGLWPCALGALRPEYVARERGSKKPVASSSSVMEGVIIRGRSDSLRDEGEALRDEGAKLRDDSAGGGALRDDGAAGGTLRARLPLASPERTSASDSSRPGRLVKGSMGPFGERGANGSVCRAQARERPSNKLDYVAAALAQAHESTGDADR